MAIKAKPGRIRLPSLLRGGPRAQAVDDLARVLEGEADPATAQAALRRVFGRRDPVALDRVHRLELQSLFLWRPEDAESALADIGRIARQVMEEFLEEGDAHGSDARGNIAVYLPGMTREAGQLKLAVIADAVVERVREAQARLPHVEARPRTAAADRRRVAGEFAETDKRFAGAQQIQHEKRRIEAGNRALAAMAARRDAEGPDAATLPYWSQILRDDEDGLSSRLAIAYRPVWRVEASLVTALACRIGIRGKAGLDGQAIEELADRERAQLDGYVLAISAARLAGAGGEERPLLYIVPVAFRSVDRDPHRLKVLAVLRSLEGALQRRIVCELTEPPAMADEARLREPVTRLQGLCRSVLVRLPPGAAELEPWRAVGVGAAGVDAGEAPADEPPSAADLRGFAARARQAGLPAYAWGLGSAPAVLAAADAGFSYLAGAPIEAAVGDASGVTRLTAEALGAAARPQRASARRSAG